MPAKGLATRTWITALALLLPATVAHAAVSGDAAARFGDDLLTMRLSIGREWSGLDANAARAWFDKTHGDADGLFTYPEHQAFVQAESRFSTFASGIKLDEARAQVGIAEVDLTGALGFAQQPNPVSLHLNVTLRFPDVNVSLEDHVLRMVFEPNTTVALLLPPGFHARDVQGLSDLRVSPDGRLVEGQGGGQTPIVVQFTGASSGASFGSRAPGGLPMNLIVLAASAAAVLLSGVVASIAVLRSRRKRWRP